MSETIKSVVRYVLIFWGVCVIAGSGMAVGLASDGMKVQDAFNSGMVVAFLPGIVVLVLGFIFIMWRMWVLSDRYLSSWLAMLSEYSP